MLESIRLLDCEIKELDQNLQQLNVQRRKQEKVKIYFYIILAVNIPLSFKNYNAILYIILL